MLSKFLELRLISQCALADNQRAFGQLVEAYQPQLRRFLLNLTMGDEALVDDLAQETFIKAYINIRSFRGISSFSTWLYRIAYNEFYSEKRRRKEQAVEEMGEAMQPTSTASVDATTVQLSVREAMKSLSEAERSVVTLFYIEDQPIKKISTITGMPEGTIKSYLHRAKEKMREVLGDQYL